MNCAGKQSFFWSVVQKAHFHGSRLKGALPKDAPSLGRRYLLVGACAVGLVHRFVPTTASAARSAGESRRLHARAAVLFGGSEAAREAAEAYLRLHPAEADAAVLTSVLLDGGALGRRDDTIDRQLAARIAGDWETGAVTQIHGWLFSRTEARLCALAHLPLAAA